MSDRRPTRYEKERLELESYIVDNFDAYHTIYNAEPGDSLVSTIVDDDLWRKFLQTHKFEDFDESEEFKKFDASTPDGFDSMIAHQVRRFELWQRLEIEALTDEELETVLTVKSLVDVGKIYGSDPHCMGLYDVSGFILNFGQILLTGQR